MAPVPSTLETETIEQHVIRLLATWRDETQFLSSSVQIQAHPAYRELQALGVSALPFLLQDLERTSDGHLASLLTSLTGAQPVPAEDRGRIRKVAEHWICWARENRY